MGAAFELWKQKAEDFKNTVDTVKETFPSAEDIAGQTQFFMFSPFLTPIEDPLFEQMIMGLVAVKLAKTPEGLKVLRDIAVQYLKTVSNIVSQLEESSSANWVTAMINQNLCLRICRRLGLISQTEAERLISKYTYMFNALMLKEGITETFTALGSFAKGISTMLPIPKV